MEKRLSPNQSTIRRKLIVLIGGQFVLFFLLVVAIFFWFQDILENKISELANQTVRAVTGNIDIHLNRNLQMLNAIVSDSEFNQLVKDNPDFSDFSSIWGQVQLIQRLKSLTAGNTDIYGVSVYNVASSKVLSTTEGSTIVSDEVVTWQQELDERVVPLDIRVDIQDSNSMFSDKEPLITLLRRIPGVGQRDNILMVDVAKQMLNYMIGEVDLWKGTAIVITNPNGQVIFRTGTDISDLKNGDTLSIELLHEFDSERPNEFEMLDIYNDSYIAVHQRAEVTDWNIYMIIPEKEIMKDFRQLRGAATTFGIILGFVFIVLSMMLYTQIVNPIKKLKQAIVFVEKGLPLMPIEIKRMDELGFLQQRFNEMIGNEQRMREMIVAEQLHKKELELKFLQSQINPHFLYNTLDSIYWVAVEKGNEEIGNVILDLSRYFRLSLSKGREYVTIGEAVDHLKYYIRIQQFRHLDKFDIHWKVEPALENLKIIKLMLQPIIENAIIHGLERRVENCWLQIEITASGRNVEFRIQDSGIGIERKRLKFLLKEIKRLDGPSEVTYGLRTIYQQLKLLYGEDMEFRMSSLPAKGTRVIIKIVADRLSEGVQHESYHSRR
ncbi:sensor histidine kinase [Paenibacillus sp. FA6]|uniref:sensor histidine kinase n=1 Tax=Paenibacillus sp. FA6 TaxID=3413029 RepID=UPI003F65F0D0